MKFRLLPLRTIARVVQLTALLMTSAASFSETISSDPGSSSAVRAQISGEQFTNSLGVRMVLIPKTTVYFAATETRVTDFEIFARETRERNVPPDFPQGEDHPVVGVTWHTAVAFCRWLTDRERKSGRISTNTVYRLPRDAEWSRAVGLDREGSGPPILLNARVREHYPWGKSWPPPNSAGNYGDSLGVDDYEFTSPVASFPPNEYGLFDLGGNVSEWCEDEFFGKSHPHRVIRGGSWEDGSRPEVNLLSSCRGMADPNRTGEAIGFRYVLGEQKGVTH